VGCLWRKRAATWGVHENVLRKWAKEFGSDPAQALPVHGQMKPEQLEIERLRREVNKLKDVFDYIERFSNATRGHSTMDISALLSSSARWD
jgi:transposase-like protein